MNSDPPKPPFNNRTTEDLIRDLDVALRQIGVRAGSLPYTPELGFTQEILTFIATVKGAHNELVHRGYQISQFLKSLSVATGWRMEELLEDSLRFPNTIPYVKDASGLRLRFTCTSCRKREFPETAAEWWCNGCIIEAREALRSQRETKRLEFFRTDDKDLWCPHANAGTQMITDDPYHDNPGLCEICLKDIAKQRGIGDAT